MQVTKTTHYDYLTRDISNAYTITQRNKFDTLQEISETLTLNDDYENFVNIHIENYEYQAN